MSTYLNPLFLLLFFALVGCQTATSEEQDTTDNTETTGQAYIPVTTDSEEARGHYTTAREQMDRGQREQARASLDQAIEADPDFAMAYVMRANLATSPAEFRQGLEKALALSDRISEAEKVMIEMYETALRADAKQRMSLAKRLVELQPEVAEAQLQLGWAHGLEDQHDQARAAFRKAIELAPEWEVPHQALAGSLLYQEPKDLAAGQEHLEKAVVLAPDNVEVQIDLGDAYRLRNQLEEARQAYRQAIDLDPKSADPYLALGRVNTLLGNYDEARQNFTQHRELSTDGKINSLSATAYIPLYQGNPDQAISELQQNLDRLGELGVTEEQWNAAKNVMLNNLAWIAVHQQDPALLAQVNERLKPVSAQAATDIGSDEAKAFFGAQETRLESLLAAMRNQPAEAKRLAEQYKAAIGDIPNEQMVKDYHFLLGYNALQQEDYATAIDQLAQSNTNFAYTKYLLAQAYDGAGNEEKALALLNELSTLNYNGVGYALVRKEVKEKLMPS